jgi:hypothetical protein
VFLGPRVNLESVAQVASARLLKQRIKFHNQSHALPPYNILDIASSEYQSNITIPEKAISSYDAVFLQAYQSGDTKLLSSSFAIRCRNDGAGHPYETVIFEKLMRSKSKSSSNPSHLSQKQ